MDYYQYKAEDFASEDYFKNWVNAPDPESDRFWSDFLKEFPEKYYDFHEGRRLVESLSAVYESSAGTDEGSARIWERLDRAINEPPFYQLIRRFYPWLAAACLLMALGCFAYFYQGAEQRSGTPVNAVAATGTIYDNPGNATRLVRLPDGSEVSIDSGSRLEYREIDGVRAATLHGGAFFKVVRQAGKTFEVSAGGVKTTVLGTSFRIRAYDKDQNVTVEVRSGKVRVSHERNELQKGNSIVLAPNQKAVFSKESQSFRKDVADSDSMFPEGTEVRNAIYIFDDAPVEKVFEAIESQYDVEIIYDRTLMKDCRLKINLEDESLNRKLDVISLALGIAYEKNGRKIVFEKRGCQ